ncbi:MAG: hypothetical protein F4Y47_07510 [Acidobacteriia bacterium]|nr:hypothetical protein [Terriglobia bacterium]MYK11127.1 hypothetical protein [Terriglobia bacterium]
MTPVGLTAILDITTWEHISSGHPEVCDPDSVALTLREPNVVQRDPADPSLLFYYRLAGRRMGRVRDLYMVVIVEDDGDGVGLVKTAYLRRDLMSEGETLWMKR